MYLYSRYLDVYRYDDMLCSTHSLAHLTLALLALALRALALLALLYITVPTYPPSCLLCSLCM